MAFSSEKKQESIAELSLRPLDEGDRGRICNWMQDLNLTQFTIVVPGPHCPPVLSPQGAEDYFDSLLKDPQRRVWAICRAKKHIGNVGLRELELEALQSECFVELGSNDDKGKGIGTWAMRALLVYVFMNLKLELLSLGVFEFNEPARKLYRRLGFVDAGQYGWHFSQGQLHRVLNMHLDKETFFRLRKAEL